MTIFSGARPMFVTRILSCFAMLTSIGVCATRQCPWPMAAAAIVL